MRDEKLSWILVEGSDAATIKAAVIKHAGIAAHEQPQAHQAAIFELSAGRFAVTFDPPAPPYAFTNLIGWLDDRRMCRGSRGSVGWLVAPGDGKRYFLTPQRPSAGEDTLFGVADDGTCVVGVPAELLGSAQHGEGRSARGTGTAGRGRRTGSHVRGHVRRQHFFRQPAVHG